MIYFYFDFLSPYSYLAFNLVYRERQKAQSALGTAPMELCPVFLPQVIMSFQKEGPGDIAVKRRYMLNDCSKKAALMALPFAVPPLPFNSSLPLRLVTSFSGQDAWDISFELFKLAWGQGSDIGDEKILDEVLATRALTLESLSEKIKEGRSVIKANHKRALEREIFGLPTFDYWTDDKKEIYWGNDSLQLLAHDLQFC